MSWHPCQGPKSYLTLPANLKLIELSENEIELLQNLGDKLERPYRTCMPGWLVRSHLLHVYSLYTLTIPVCFRTGWGSLGFPDCADQIPWD
jgi:hypothetical protein